MACGRVAMEIEGTGWFQHAVEFEQAVGHHGEIGHHVVRSKELSQGDHHLGDIGMLALLEFGELALGLFAPMPAIFECGDLRVGLVSLRGFEEDGIIALGIERRIEIDKIDRLRRDVLAENIEVVAEIEFVQLGFVGLFRMVNRILGKNKVGT